MNANIQEVAEHIYRISVPLPNNPLKELNSYLIRDTDHSLLIDTGFRMDACRDALLAGLKELGQDPGSMDIFVTHLHSDHCGLAPELIAENRSIYISEIDRTCLADIESINVHWDTNTKRLREAAMPESIISTMTETNPAISYAPRPGCPNYVAVKDGHVFHIAGYHLRCVLTPGHTPGHMCLWDEEKRLMFTGDHVLFDITPNITAWHIREDSLGDYLDSLGSILSYPVETALPSHRKTGDFHARIRELLEHHQVRLDEVVSIVSKLPGSTAYDIAGNMTWSIRARNWDDFPVSQKFFAVGECMSHLDHLLAQNRIRREMDGSVYRYYPA